MARKNLVEVRYEGSLFAHVIYDNPDSYSYEFILDDDRIEELSEQILSEIQNNYNEIEKLGKLNAIGIRGWEDYFEENGIKYKEGDWFPHKVVIESIQSNAFKILKSNIKSNEKYNALNQAVNQYTRLYDFKSLMYHECVFLIELFDNSHDFARHLFQYLKDSIDYVTCLEPFEKRIDNFLRLIENKNSLIQNLKKIY